MHDSARPAAGMTQQTELYGEPLGVTVRTVTTTLGLSQAAVARTLGISAPMLSQLMSGQRVKIGNPHAVRRLESLLQLAHEVRGGLAHHQVAGRLDAIREDEPATLTRARPVDDVPQVVGRLLRALASGQDLEAAAARLDPEHPALAEMIRVYGTGSAEEADRHYAGVRHLL